MGGLTGLTGGGLCRARGEDARGEVDGCGAGISDTCYFRARVRAHNATMWCVRGSNCVNLSVQLVSLPHSQPRALRHTTVLSNIMSLL